MYCIALDFSTYRHLPFLRCLHTLNHKFNDALVASLTDLVKHARELVLQALEEAALVPRLRRHELLKGVNRLNATTIIIMSKVATSHREIFSQAYCPNGT